ncbi:hypothetical protein AGOR_G00170940 [Albula goreensis]|uniref:Kinesin-like protein n=1 Tax=Albula goreensis TaxID=1534307 RepID=A0A8T3CXW9_9TELE|nr:hypothetical protein AGOR_G00170940 [Albula goreensis]
MAASDMCSHVKVVVRVRPENSKEQEGNYKKIVHVVDNHMLIFDPKEQDLTFFRAQRLRNRDVNKRPNKDLKFVFDCVFGEDSSQLDVFNSSTREILDGILNGYNCTVFAYGATGAGKTHTMLGSDNNPGVMYLTMKELFNRIDEVKDEKIFDVAFSYLEVYNEQIRDLLAKSGPLAVREDSTRGVVVQGLTLHQPKSAEHILEALDYGNKNRTQHPTDVNATSSRSHAVFQIYLRQQDKTASLNPNVRVAKMSLIDLAGSERASATNTRGARFREGANINRSLLALGNVINTLADPKSKKAHIPYRDSKLTRLLKDSLGGNCRTIMIANISPSSMSYDDTYNTLRYANRAKEIKSSLKSNVVSLDSHISQYAVVCEKQRQEIMALKQKLKEYEDRKSESDCRSPSSVSKKARADFERMEEVLQHIFRSRGQLRRDVLGLEVQLKENELRRSHRMEWQQQIQLLCAEDKATKATCRYERKLASLLTHHQHLKRRLSEVEHHFLENQSWLHRVENEMKLLGPDGNIPKVLEKDLQCHKLQLQVEDLKQHVEHMTHLISLQDQENKQTKKMMTSMLSTLRSQYRALKDSGLATSSQDAEYQELEQLVLREKGVAWADQHQAQGSDTLPSQSHLASILTFSHLVCDRSTPCKQETKENSLPVPAALEPPPKKPTRRKLTVSPAVPVPGPSRAQGPGPGPALPQCPLVLQDDGVFPLQYTPELCRAEPHAAPYDPNATIDIADGAETTSGNTTITISPGTGGLDMTASDSHTRSLKRLEIPSLLDDRRSKPSYMAMTSAAQNKRKHFSCALNNGKDFTQGPNAPKRVKHDTTQSIKPMRVRGRFGGSEENIPDRRVVRSVSEGNLDLIGVKKPKSSFLRTQQLFRRVTKRL